MRKSSGRGMHAARLVRTMVDSGEVSATVAKNEFGRVLDAALRRGRVVITKHDVPRAVLLSAEEYSALAREAAPDLDQLDAEFDALLEAMQTKQARSAVRALLSASPSALARASVAGARRRRRPARKRG